MMELVLLLFTCLNILNIAVATPYGYGIQSGAVVAAKADASAGAFGGVGAVPLSIPSGGSFTGSYSKSSSSSFAASSASSTSASFSVSGSGAGPYGHRLNGIPGSIGCATGTCQSGCASGNCQPTENKDVITSSFDNSAGASAIAKDDKYSGCNGGNCQGNPTNFDCKGGQCSSNLPTNSDLNDIQVKGVDASNYNDKSTNYASGFSGANSGAGAYNNKPSTYLTAPKNNPCTSAQCGFDSGNIYDTAKPSSYNVPIHGSYGNPPSVEKSPCASGKCGNPSSDSTYIQNTRPDQNGCTSGNCGGNPPSGSYGFNQHKGCTSGNCGVNTPSESYGYNPQKGCTSGDCGSFPSTQQSPDFSKPSYPKNNSPYGTSGCSTPNCGGNSPQSSQTSYTGFPQPAPSQSNIGVSVGANAVGQTSIAGSTAEKDPYKGGFGGPSGLLKPNDFSVSVSLNSKPSLIATSVPSHTPCSSGNCGPKPQYEFPNKLNEPAPVGPYNPSPCLSGKCSNPGSTLSNNNNNNPSFSGGTYVHVTGFGGPSGILKPNDHVVSSVLPSNYGPTSIHKPRPSSYPCLSGTCGSSLSPSNPPAAHKQTSPTGPSVNIPNPSGSYYSAAEPTHAIPQYNPSEISSSPCISGNCNSNQPQSTYTQSFSTPGQSCPSGNCGRFSANPNNCKNGKCGTPISQVSPLSTLPVSNSPCSTGNCGFSTGQSFPQSGPQNSYNPTECTFGNCATAQNPGYSHNSGAHAAAGAAAASGSKAVIYMGGFGGPPGLLKPYDDGKLKNIPNFNIPPYNPGVPTAGSSYGKSINLSGGLVSSGKALGLAAAGAASGAFGSSTYPSGNTKSGGGCNSGCGGQSGGSAGLNGGFSEGAAAKSAAIAGAGAGSYGGAGSFASSSASAYASAGASAKGGYGGR